MLQGTFALVPHYVQARYSPTPSRTPFAGQDWPAFLLLEYAAANAACWSCVMSYVFPQEREVLEMLAGLRPRTSAIWVDTCLKSLAREGYCTDGPSHRMTEKGRVMIGLRTEKQH